MTTQLQILNKILATHDYSIVTSNNLTSDHFNNYESEFKFIKTHVDTYGQVPDTLTFLNTFPEFDIQEVTEPDNYLVSELLSDSSVNSIIKIVNTMQSMLSQGKSNEEVTDYFKKSSSALSENKAVSCVDIMSDFSRFDRYLDKKQNQADYYISTGFAELDNILGGIDRENENMVIAARTGVGKTWTLTKMAVAAYDQGLRVGYYSGEMSVDKLAYRVDTLRVHISNMQIARGELFVEKDYRNYIEGTRASKTTGTFNVLTPADVGGPVTVGALRAFVEKYNIEILFIDQYSLLEDESKAKVMHEKVANISKAIKQLQVIKKIPIISVAQMNRTKNEDGSQDTTQIGLSDRIGQDATVIIMLDKEEHTFSLNIVKARDGGDGRKLLYNVDLDKGQFYYLPSTSDGTSEEDAQALHDSYAVDEETPF